MRKVTLLTHALKMAVITLLAIHQFTPPAAAKTVVISGKELTQLLSGKTARFQGGRRAIYKADGSYQFKTSGQTERGTWSVSGSKVCVTFVNNFHRCDQYLKNGNDYFWRDADGNVFPVAIK